MITTRFMTALTWGLVLAGGGLISGCAGATRERLAGETVRATPSDFDPLVGSSWRGTLTYLDYTSNKSTEIPSSLAVTKGGENVWMVAFGYDDEPQANAASTLKLIEDGSVLLNGDSREPVVLRRVENGTVEIITEFRGNDNNRPATIRKNYAISAREASIRKMVRFDGEAEYFKRHEYQWRR